MRIKSRTSASAGASIRVAPTPQKAERDKETPLDLFLSSLIVLGKGPDEQTLSSAREKLAAAELFCSGDRLQATMLQEAESGADGKIRQALLQQLRVMLTDEHLDDSAALLTGAAKLGIITPKPQVQGQKTSTSLSEKLSDAGRWFSEFIDLRFQYIANKAMGLAGINAAAGGLMSGGAAIMTPLYAKHAAGQLFANVSSWDMLRYTFLGIPAELGVPASVAFAGWVGRFVMYGSLALIAFSAIAKTAWPDGKPIEEKRQKALAGFFQNAVLAKRGEGAAGTIVAERDKFLRHLRFLGVIQSEERTFVLAEAKKAAENDAQNAEAALTSAHDLLEVHSSLHLPEERPGRAWIMTKAVLNYAFTDAEGIDA